MKIILAIIAAIGIYVALGHLLPIANSTAVVITILGNLGAITYKFLAAVVGFALIRST